MRKYVLKTRSLDPRPVKDYWKWTIIGSGIDDNGLYSMIVIWLKPNEDVFEYYPEAYDVKLGVEKTPPQIKRGEENSIHMISIGLPYSESIKYSDDFTPTFLAVIQKLAEAGLSLNEMAKRMGINGKRFRKMVSHPIAKNCIEKGLTDYMVKKAEEI